MTVRFAAPADRWAVRQAVNLNDIDLRAQMVKWMLCEQNWSTLSRHGVTAMPAFPRRLDETRHISSNLSDVDRRILAHYFGVYEEVLGGTEAPPVTQAPIGHLVAAPILSLGASAGHGSLYEQERSGASLCFDSR